MSELSRSTKLSQMVLEEIEKDRFSTLPNPIFIKGYLKSYAQQVGLNVDEVLTRFEKQPLQSASASDRNVSRLGSKNQIVWIVLFIALVITLATFLSSR